MLLQAGSARYDKYGAETLRLLGEWMGEDVKGIDFSPYLKRQPVTLTLLTGLAIILFLAVSGLSRIYQAQQTSLANEWSNQGKEDLNARRFSHAVADFRTALLYSRDNYSFQLSLAEALIGLNRPDEANAYLINLWDREPENGRVNLELARIASSKREMETALRYYHNAIYATWPADEEAERQSTRLELIDLLLRNDARTQAESELIALAANANSDPSQQAHLGELFLRAEDYGRALAAFRVSLNSAGHNQIALAGAGQALFQLGKYSLARPYLEQAVAEAPSDNASAACLKTTEFVLQMDPYQQPASAVDRRRIAMEAFAVAGARLKSCGSSGNPAPPAALQQSLGQEWTKLKPQITERGLKRDPDLINTAMNLVFRIERQTTGTCGVPTEVDNALYLVANLHEGN